MGQVRAELTPLVKRAQQALAEKSAAARAEEERLKKLVYDEEKAQVAACVGGALGVSVKDLPDHDNRSVVIDGITFTPSTGGTCVFGLRCPKCSEITHSGPFNSLVGFADQINKGACHHCSYLFNEFRELKS